MLSVTTVLPEKLFIIILCRYLQLHAFSKVEKNILMLNQKEAAYDMQYSVLHPIILFIIFNVFWSRVLRRRSTDTKKIRDTEVNTN